MCFFSFMSKFLYFSSFLCLPLFYSHKKRANKHIYMYMYMYIRTLHMCIYIAFYQWKKVLNGRKSELNTVNKLMNKYWLIEWKRWLFQKLFSPCGTLIEKAMNKSIFSCHRVRKLISWLFFFFLQKALLSLSRFSINLRAK